MKKFLAILLSALMLMNTWLAACGTSDEPSGESAAPRIGSAGVGNAG